MSPGIAFVLLFFAVGVSNLVYSLNCSSCELTTSWDECRNRSETMECSIKQVNRYHEDMSDSNPTLEVLDETAENVTFSCFSMEMKFTDGDLSQSGIVSGCTFKQQKICKGWNQETTVVKCDMCQSEMICSAASSCVTKLLFLSAGLVIVNVFRKVCY